MDLTEHFVVGLECIALATDLLHRVRLADPTAGLWEAADVQWWWRRARVSDSIEQRFWLDSHGPVGAVLLSEWDGTWQCDPIVVPEHVTTLLPEVWGCALTLIERLELRDVEVLAHDGDDLLQQLLLESGFARRDESLEQRCGIAWMSAAHRPLIPALPDGYGLIDRAHPTNRTHWLEARSGADVEPRLRQCSLYDPELDLAVEASDGGIAAYGLFWFDPVTSVGLVEPMRTEDAHQRRGLARAVLANGLDRLAARGAQRLKVGYETDAARNLYLGSGFQPAAPGRTYIRQG